MPGVDGQLTTRLRSVELTGIGLRMRAKVPPPFEQCFDGPEGRYKLEFRPLDDWDGQIQTTINGHQMLWDVLNVETDTDAGLVLGGMTHGSEAIWDDVFWFELCLDDEPRTIRFWGDKVIWRQDLAAPN